jgi:hypothetical protein
MALISSGWGMGVAVGATVAVSVGADVRVGSAAVMETGIAVGVVNEAEFSPHAERMESKSNIDNQ